jgi:hypothetical protein
LDREQDDVERPVPQGHPPPRPVVDRVAQVQDPHAVRLGEPGDLRVADPVRGRQRGERERTDGDRLPRGDPPALEAGGGQLVVGLRQGGVLEGVAAGRRGLEHRGAGRERGGERGGVGVVAVQVGDQAGHRPAGSGRHDLRQRRPRRALAQRREHRARVLQGIDDHRRAAGVELHPGPAQPCQPHGPTHTVRSFVL